MVAMGEWVRFEVIASGFLSIRSKNKQIEFGQGTRNKNIYEAHL